MEELACLTVAMRAALSVSLLLLFFFFGFFLAAFRFGIFLISRVYILISLYLQRSDGMDDSFWCSS